MAGVNVGKVKTKELDKGGARTIVEVQLDEQYAPNPEGHEGDPAAEEALLGETYLELRPVTRTPACSPTVRAWNAQVEDTTELDEIFTAFDPSTRKAFQAG